MYFIEVGIFVVVSNDGLVGIKFGSNELFFNFIDYGWVKLEEFIFILVLFYVMVV